jgi:hypothetical protein
VTGLLDTEIFTQRSARLDSPIGLWEGTHRSIRLTQATTS